MALMRNYRMRIDKKIKLIGFILALFIGFYLLYLAYYHNQNELTQEIRESQIVIIDLTQKDRKNGDWYFYSGIVVVSVTLVFATKNYLSLKEPKSDLSKRLTEQERKIAQLMQQEISNKQIAQELCISLSTVKTHINNIYRKYKVFSRTEFLEAIENQEV